MNTLMRKTTVLILTLSITILIGCNAVPQKYTEIPQQENNTILSKDKKPYNIVITEFNVEFVTGKYENFFWESQLKIPILDAIPLMGIGRRTIKLKEEKYKQLCDEMYRRSITALTKRDVTVLPSRDVTHSGNYRRFSTANIIYSNFLQYLNPIGSDTGSTKAYKILPATGLYILNAMDDNERKIETALLNELNADLSLRFHIRVGTFRNFATIESGSVILVTSKEFTKQIAIPRSIVSNEQVVADTYTHPGGKVRVTLDDRQYLAAINKMFANILSLAFTNPNH